MNKRFLTLFPLTAIAAAVGIALSGCGGSSGSDAVAQPTAGIEVKPIASVAFTDTPAPTASEVDKMSQTYTTSVAKVTYTDGSTKDFPLSYNTLFSVNQTGVGGNKNPSGQLYDDKLNPLMDPYGKPLVAETPDANSLLNIDGNLWLVTHYEYDWILSDGVQAYKTAGWYSRAPMSMTLSGISQDKGTGKLSVASQKPIDFSAVNGLWIPCFGSQTPWNTHLGSEEDYDMIYNPLTKDYSKTTAGVKAMTELYFKNAQTANPYN